MPGVRVHALGLDAVLAQGGDELAAAAPEVEHGLVRFEQAQVPLLEGGQDRRGITAEATLEADVVEARRRSTATRGRTACVAGGAAVPAEAAAGVRGALVVVARRRRSSAFTRSRSSANRSGTPTKPAPGAIAMPSCSSESSNAWSSPFISSRLISRPATRASASRVSRASSGSRWSRSAATSACITLSRTSRSLYWRSSRCLSRSATRFGEAVEAQDRRPASSPASPPASSGPAPGGPGRPRGRAPDAARVPGSLAR